MKIHARCDQKRRQGKGIYISYRAAYFRRDIEPLHNVSKLERPPSAFNGLDRFKLFVFDTELLKRMA